MAPQTTYNISEADRLLIGQSKGLFPAPALVLATPSGGEVGEDDFINDYANLVYDKNVGAEHHRKDSFSRHIAYRNLPFDSSAHDYQQFCNGLAETNPFSDTFFGVDAISMSGWTNKRFTGLGWSKLKHHVSNNSHTDFLFIMNDVDYAQVFAKALQKDTGLAVETVELLPPTPEQLACFVSNRIALPQGCIHDFCSWLEDVSVEHAANMNYTWAGRLATKAVMSGKIETAEEFLEFLSQQGTGLFFNNGKKLGF